MLSNCGSDEYGGAAGGVAGDQTGREYAIISWYNGNWTHVFRYPETRVQRLITRLAIQAPLNDFIGYDQGERLTFWYRLVESGYDPSAIRKACESDCSASTAAIIKAVGILLGIPKLANVWEGMSTWVEVETLRAAGFIDFTDADHRKGIGLLPGDVLLKYGHTAIYIGSGKLVDFPAEEDDVVTDQDKRDIAKLVWEYVNSDDANQANQYNRLANVMGGVDSIRANLAAIADKVDFDTPIVPLGGDFYRLINTGNGAHTFTNSEDRHETLSAHGWTDQGVKFTLGTDGTPVYELTNPYSDDCILTTHMAEAESLAKAGWQSIGIVGTTGKGAEVYRLINNANGMHLFTTDTNEVRVLKSSGWAEEGVAFKAA